MVESAYIKKIRNNISLVNKSLDEIMSTVEYLSDLENITQSDVNLLEKALTTSDDSNQALKNAIRTFVMDLVNNVEEIDVLETENGFEI